VVAPPEVTPSHSLTNRACSSHLEPYDHDITDRQTASRVTLDVTVDAIGV